MVSRLWEKAGSCTKSRVDFAFWAGKGRILNFGRKKLDPAQNQVAILHFGKKKVESAKYGAVLFGG